MPRLPSVVLRFLLGVWLLSSCTLYHKVFHPYRLPTPKPSPEFKAQQKAKKEKQRGLLAFTRKADKSKRKSGDGADVEEAATDVSTPSGGTVTVPSAAPAARTLAEKSTVRYDKKGMMKKPKLKRRRINKPAGKGFHPLQSIRDFFKYGLHKKPNYDIDHRAVPPAPKAAPDAAPAGPDKP